jgi:hypothetical protein
MGCLVTSRTREALAVLSVLALLVLPTGCPLDLPANATGAVHVYATLDGSSWVGPVDFTVTGQAAGTAVPESYADVPIGDYSLNYVAGGPPEAVLSGITPSGSQNLTSGGAVTFTLDFRTKEVARSNVVVLATVRQADEYISWLGPVNFILTGPDTLTGVSVPHVNQGMPLGDYRLEYVSGGPPGATFLGITPSTAQTLSAGDTLTFTMEFG